MALKHKTVEVLKPFKHTCLCKIMTILNHIHIQPCRPPHKTLRTTCLLPLLFISSFQVVPVLVINCPFSLAFDMVFPFKMNKEYVILQIFLISSMWACIILQPQTDIHEQKYMYWYIQESKECANINTEESTIQNCF